MSLVVDMSLVIVYFHGYGSSPMSDKVTALRNHLKVPVVCFETPVDPVVAKANIEYHLDMLLLEDMHADDRLLFVGTSLGGWMASEMGAKYDVPAIVINPSMDPATSLAKYDVPEDVRAKYTPIKTSARNTYFMAERDEVIPNESTVAALKADGYEVYVDPLADHRFSGVSFNRVISYIRKKYL